MKRFICVVAFIVGILPAAAHAKPENFAKVAPDGKRGAIMFAAPVLPAPYVVWISQTAPDGKPGKTIRIAVSANKAVIDPSTGLALKLSAAEPGSYVVRMLLWQGHWGACLARQTVGFTVQPGQISYLGTFNPVETLGNLETEVKRTGKTSAHSYQLRMFRDNIAAPSFTGSEPSMQKAVDLARRNGLSTALVSTEVATHPAAFSSPTGSDMIGYCD